MSNTIFKIRQAASGYYSRGRVSKVRYLPDLPFDVKWKTTGKEWTTEKALKAHLLTCIQKGVDMTGWEILEYAQRPTRSLTEWCDAKMTMARLKSSS